MRPTCLLQFLFVLLPISARAAPLLDFRDSRTLGWESAHDCRVSGSGEGLRIAITGSDPYCMGPRVALPNEERLVVRIRLRSETGGAGQLFYFTRDTREEDSIRFGVAAGEWRDVWLTIPRTSPELRFRLDPPGTSGECVVESIDVIPGLKPTWPEWTESAPLSAVDSITMTCGPVTLRHAHTQAGRFEVDVQGLPTATSGVIPQIAITRDGLTKWLPLESGGVTRIGEHTIRSLAHAALPDGGTLTLTQQFIRSQQGTIECRVELSTTMSCELVFAPLLMMYPGHRSFAAEKHQGLFAGVEYLENEPSSSDADVDPARALRRVPSSDKITLPLMAVEADGRYLGLVWEPNPDRVAAYFDSPDRQFGLNSHVLGLIAPGAQDGRRKEGQELPLVPERLSPGQPIVVTARLIGGASPNIVGAVQHATSICGLPVLPEVPQHPAELLAHGWLDTPLKVGDRFRHAVVGDSFQPQPAADAIWMMRQLSSSVTDQELAGRLKAAADSALLSLPADHLHHAAIGHVRYPNGTLLLGDPVAGMTQARQSAIGQLSLLGPESRIVYQPHPGRLDFSRTHWTKESNGIDGLAVSRGIAEAIFSGDQRLIDQSLSQLRKLNRYLGTVPRGAQTWEIPLHTPDILASAHLVSAYLQGYEVTRDPELLEQAKYWAWTGVPFVYLRPQFRGTVGPYATTPVLGATHWNSVLWIGLPVQWCGLVYAESLHDLAEYDPHGPWKTLADGIVISGIQQTYPEGPHKGLLPDSFNLLGQSRNPADINPGTLQIPALRTLTGRRSYQVRKLLETGWTVIAPCGIRVRSSSATQAEWQVDSGIAGDYSLMVHGLTQRPMVSVQGCDSKGEPLVKTVHYEERFEANTGTLILKLAGDAIVSLQTTRENSR